MRLFLFILKFFLLGAFFIISNNNLALSDSNNRAEFFSFYGAWLSEIGGNIISATGNIVKMEWLPQGDHDLNKNEVKLNYNNLIGSEDKKR